MVLMCAVAAWLLFLFCSELLHAGREVRATLGELLPGFSAGFRTRRAGASRVRRLYVWMDEKNVSRNYFPTKCPTSCSFSVQI